MKKNTINFHKLFLISIIIVVVIFGINIYKKVQSNIVAYRAENSAATLKSKISAESEARVAEISEKAEKAKSNKSISAVEKVFLLGGSNFSANLANDVWESSGPLTSWNLISPSTATATPANKWAWTNNFCAVSFNNKIFVISPGASKNEIWSSPDGVSWTRVSNSPAFINRESYSCVVFKNEIWITGGTSIYGGTNLNDVWHSPDGITWSQHVPVGAVWSPRIGHETLVFQNKLWVLGGGITGSGNPAYGDVWNTSDGVHWTHVDTNLSVAGIQDAPWPSRVDHASLVFGNKMWVLGGFSRTAWATYNDIWSSVDGINWVKETSNAPWTARILHQAIAYDNKMWVLGGGMLGSVIGAPVRSSLNDIWSSVDGTNWTQVTSSAQWWARIGHMVVVAPVIPQKPDLIITDITFRNQPIKVSITDPYTYYDITIKNIGTAPAVLGYSGLNAFEIILSSIPNTVSGGNVLAGMMLGSTQILQPGQSHTFKNRPTRYDSKLRGTAQNYLITGTVDSMKLIDELNENNNAYSVNLTIFP